MINIHDINIAVLIIYKVAFGYDHIHTLNQPIPILLNQTLSIPNRSPPLVRLILLLPLGPPSASCKSFNV